MAPRRRRANGEESRQRIIDAATEIASERGYDGTSINAVSERSGLPPSSIYWHFRDKDDLIAAVIEHSFGRWLEQMRTSGARDVTDSTDPRAATVASTTQVGRAIAQSSDFLRLGLMLTLERRPEEPAARTNFLKVRHQALEDAIAFYGRLHRDDLTPCDVRLVAVTAMALTDGLFIAREVDADLPAARLFELAGIAVDAVARHLVEERAQVRRRRRAADRPA